MGKNSLAEWKNRALVTETLPYEVPVIFTNDKFYDLLSRPDENKDVNKAINKIIEIKKGYSIPYQYNIAKDSLRKTKLSIIHPLWQAEICDFYAAHEGSLLSYCSKSRFSIRKPVAVSPSHIESSDEPSSLKLGKVEEEALRTSHFISYFIYGKYSLLSRFYDSKEFLRLEKTYKFLRTLDISKCFYHIYTHSLTWAVKSKSFAKEHSNSYSFEGRFDKLMQQTNYNETNGIVVGPEISRIFAEIILQEVDNCVLKRLEGKNLFEGKDYTIRRYVDDISIFSNTHEHLDMIEVIVADELEKIKLFLNKDKIKTYSRPFITPLSMARTELGIILKSLEDILSTENDLTRKDAVKLLSFLTAARSIVTKYGIGLSSISGWTLSSLIRIVHRANGKLFENKSPDSSKNWAYAISKILELAFHVCSLDFRVRTTYSLCQILSAVNKVKHKPHETDYYQIEHLLAEELCLLTHNHSFEEECDSVELYNILISGAHFLKKEYLGNAAVESKLNELMDSPLTYFKFITLTFCFNTNPSYYTNEVTLLNRIAKDKLLTGESFKNNSEQFLLFCDFLSSPLVSVSDKKFVYEKLLGGTISTTTIQSLAQRIGFVQWDLPNISHLLRKKELRPVYSVA